MSRSDAIGAAYLLCAALFIIGLKRLSSPATARSGNQIAAVGMAIAIAATLFDERVVTFEWIIVGALIGGIGGAIGARRVKMTAMPQMVALFNGLGGGAAALVALADYHDTVGLPGHVEEKIIISILFSAVVGSVSFAGSMIAFGKLQDVVTGNPVTVPGQRLVTGIIFAAILAGCGYLATGHESQALLVGILAVSLVLGVQMVMAIGGADMPVVISLLNAFTGLATASTGFVLSNNVLIIAGTLVGASGSLLTQMMGKAMNRSLANMVFGAFGTAGSVALAEGPGGDRSVRSASADDIAIMLAYARRVVIVPGYGLAVAQAQHNVRELGDLLQSRGVDVRYAIHPVAGRMPGHMNVLLAEADVPYTQLYEMDDINGEFPRTDVSLVIGANDVVNPAAKNTPGSPIYGMPILNVDESSATVVAQALDEHGLRRDRERALLRPQDDDAVRRRQGVGDRPHERRQGGLSRHAPACLTPELRAARHADAAAAHLVRAVGGDEGADQRGPYADRRVAVMVEELEHDHERGERAHGEHRHRQRERQLRRIGDEHENDTRQHHQRSQHCQFADRAGVPCTGTAHSPRYCRSPPR